MGRKLIEKDICPSCTKEFDCSRSQHCWCFEHDVKPEMLVALEKEYDGCLCPECLLRFEGQ